MVRSHLLIAGALLVATPGLAAPPPGPAPVQTLVAADAVLTALPRRVAHARLPPFVDVEVRRADSAGDATLWMAVRVGDAWYQAAPLTIWAMDGHTCHADVSKVGAIKLRQGTLADGRAVAVAQIDVTYTTYMTCPEPPQRGRVRVGEFHERHFLLCAPGATADAAPRCAAPISTRQREICPRAATFKDGVLDAPCDAWQLDAQGNAIDLEPGLSTLAL